MSQLDYQAGALVRSSENFTARFRLPIHNQDDAALEFLRERFDAVIEEVREFKNEVSAGLLDLAVQELVDVIYVSLQTLTQLDPEIVAREMAAIIEKNNNKTTETHHVCVGGKVRRNNDSRYTCAIHSN